MIRIIITLSFKLFSSPFIEERLYLEELREIACAKYEDYKPLLDEMIKRSLDIGQIDMYELLIESKEKLEKYMSESEWQEAIAFMDRLLEV